jgi:16S rRNA C967 or C1407 C5-methylase (RsmB/RsmF family)/NOL1/NOP2/fmu family ribosome biogenesis protein
MADKRKYPEAFVEKMTSILGDESGAFFKSLEEASPTSLRLNPNKTAAIFQLSDHIPWCKDGRYIAERPSFTFDPLFHAGSYYVQEASSMYVEQVWNMHVPKNEPLWVLDLCAAPGGKSTHLLSLMNEESFLVSNEFIGNRNKILYENICKWGKPNCIITQNEPAKFSAIGEYFDVILVDAPCSGEGLFRKDENAINEWSEKNVLNCALRQSEILQHATQSLKPGGILIYSTCTYEASENDEQIEKLLQAGQFEALEIPVFEGIVRTKFGLQFYPHKVVGEGFFIAALRKKGDRKLNTENVASPQTTDYYNILLHGEFTIRKKNEMDFAIPAFMVGALNLFEKNIYIKNAGLLLGQTKGKDFLPSHDLALSVVAQLNFESVELDTDDAIRFLRCETPKCEIPTRGWHVAKFKGFNIGWLKVMDGRMNNYFPRDRRILKSN